MFSATVVRRKTSAGSALSAALSVMAAVSGASFASGQAVVLFFSQLGPAAWPGMIVACLLFAGILRLMAHFGDRTLADSLPAALMRVPGKWPGRIALGLYGLFSVLAALRMADISGGIGALVLPVRHGYFTGCALAVIAAVIMAAAGNRAMTVLGAGAVLFSVMLYSALMLDPRPVTTYMRLETVLNLSGNMGAALALAALFAAMNAALSCQAVFPAGKACLRKAAPAAGGLMLLCLLCAHGAVLRGGEALFVQSLPIVILAARWGVAGFWLSAGYMYFMCVCTLSAAVKALSSLASAGNG